MHFEYIYAWFLGLFCRIGGPVMDEGLEKISM
jgi:hypothetical protein